MRFIEFNNELETIRTNNSYVESINSHGLIVEGFTGSKIAGSIKCEHINIVNCHNTIKVADNIECTVIRVAHCPSLINIADNITSEIVYIHRCPSLELPKVKVVIIGEYVLTGPGQFNTLQILDSISTVNRVKIKKDNLVYIELINRIDKLI